jgi:hypothetical protein
MFAFVSLACAHHSPAATAPVSIRPPAANRPGRSRLTLLLTPGETHRYRFNMTVGAEIATGGPDPLEVPLHISGESVLEIGATEPDGTLPVRQRLEQLRIAGQGQMSQTFAVFTRALTGASVRLSLRTDGTVVTMRTVGLDDRLLESLMRQITQAARPFGVLPTRPVAVGDSWDDEDTQAVPLGDGAPAQLLARSHHVFARVEPCGDADCAVLQATTTLAVRDGGMARLNGTGSGQTTLAVKLDDGWPRWVHGSRVATFAGMHGGQALRVASDLRYEAELR